jgi:hypothetical protein
MEISVHKFIPRFPFHLSGGTLTAGGECPHEKVIDSFPVDLCPADHSGLSRSWLFNLKSEVERLKRSLVLFQAVMRD